MDAPEEQEVATLLVPVGEAVEIDAVVNGRDVVEFTASIRFADGHVVASPVVFLVDGKDLR